MVDSHWFLNRFVSSITAAFAGLIVALFFMPEQFKQLPKPVQFFLVFGIGMFLGFVLSGVLLQYLHADSSDWDNSMGAGALIGSLSTAVPMWVANTIRKRAHRDVVEVVKEVRSGDVLKSKEAENE